MGFGLSLGQYDYNNAPWLRPATPSIDTSMPWSNMSMFNNVPAWGCVPSWNSVPAWNNALSYDGVPNSSASSNAPETFEQRKARLDKQRQQVIKLNEAKQEATKTLDEVDTQVQEIEKGKQEDGSSKVEDKRKLKDMTFWQKAGKVGMGILTGTINVAKSLVGFDKDGKWSLKKCLKNVAIGVGVATLCVFAAPAGAALAAALGGGAIASAIGATVAAAPTILAYTGLAAGVAGVGKGIYKACKSETAQELDNASQDIGSGLAIALASKAGLKKMSTTGGFTKGDGGFLGLKNVFVNPWKASNANYAQVADAMSRVGGGWKGFSFGCKYARRIAKNNAVEESKNNFKNEMTSKVSKLEKQINDAQTKVNNATGAEKQIAQAELDARLNNYTKLLDAKNKTDWQNITVKNDKVSLADKFKMSAEDRAAYRAVRKANKDYNKAVSELKSLKFKSIRKMLGNKRYKNEAEEFGYSNNSGFNGIQNRFDCFKIGVTKKKFKSFLINIGFVAIDPSWAFVGPAQKFTASPFGFANLVSQTVDPIHEFSGEHISAEDVKTLTAELNAQKEQIQKEINSINKKTIELSRA